MAKLRRPSLDLGNERDQRDQHKPRGPQSRPDLESDRDRRYFTHDGHSDILWQNTATGQVSIWEMDGDTRIGGGLVGSDPGPSWKALGTGDFNADGHSDILWRNANGQTAIWELNGTSVTAHGTIASNPGLSWNEVATGDFNGDGHSDILWQNANGQASIWEMNGTTRIGGGAVGANPGARWLAA
jgi:hypothetical protein